MRRRNLSRNGLLTLARHEALVLMVGPKFDASTSIGVTRVPLDLLEQAYRAVVAAVAAGDCPDDLRRLTGWDRSPCHRTWAWWMWTQGEEPLYGVDEALRLLELGELSDEEIDTAIVQADESLDKIGRRVWHGVGSQVLLAEALIEATGRERLPYDRFDWDGERSEWVTV
jgi:hypothetical protein